VSRKSTIQNTLKKQYSNVVRLCAAGSGKTYGICQDALSIVADPAQRKRVLITTFTNNGVDTINKYATHLNRGIPSSSIVVCTWFQFLLAEIIKPYQTYLVGINEIKSFDFDNNYPKYKIIKGKKINMAASGQKERYINRGSNILSNYASELAVFLNKAGEERPIRRLTDIYSHIYIDEIQDMAGYDIDLILLLMQSNISVSCVGDYKQATYKTNTGSKNKKTSGKNIGRFCDLLSEQELASIDRNFTTRRFNKNICDFANKIFPFGDEITSDIETRDLGDGVFLIQRADVQDYFKHYQPIVLKYDSRTSTTGWQSFNFGSCKGMTFERVLVFPNPVLTEYIQKGKSLEAPEKYYVGVTRARHSLAFVVDSFPKKTNRFQEIDLTLPGGCIKAMKYILDEQRVQ
jgi:superfamily I DNA/RNA helicase